MNADAALKALTALAHPTRLAAFRHLVQSGPEGMPVGQLRDRLAVPPATLTAHLHGLRSAGLVRDHRQGRVIRLHADLAVMTALLAYLTENCCGGERRCFPSITCAAEETP